MNDTNTHSPNDSSRRSFVKTAGTAAAAGTAISFPSVILGAPNDKKLKIGVIGTGGRGGGAMLNALKADDNVEVWAAGDLYLEAAENKLHSIRKSPEAQGKVSDSIASRIFGGIDSYKKAVSYTHLTLPTKA